MATSKNKSDSVSLTRKALLQSMASGVVELEACGFKFFAKPMSEVRRSTRSTQAFDDSGEVKREFLALRRVYAIIDHVCTKEGEPVFTDKDTRELERTDAKKIDQYFRAIEDAFGEEEEAKNE